MLFVVRRHPRLGYGQSSWPWKSTHARSELNRHTPRLHTSHAKPHVILSGIQPTGVPHLGNYLGALQQWARLQNEASPSTQLLYSIVDLHAITTDHDADQLRRWKRETLATLLAVGLDPERSTIFYQSAVWFHGMTAVLVGIYVLRICRFRNTQSWCGYWAVQPPWDTFLAWRSGRFVITRARLKEGRLFHLDWFSTEQAHPIWWSVGVGLYECKSRTQTGAFLLSCAAGCGYPAIRVRPPSLVKLFFAYSSSATHVPVGEDQVQHLEFARQCADQFNTVHGEILVKPQTVLCASNDSSSLSRVLFF